MHDEFIPHAEDQPVAVAFTDVQLRVTLSDGREIATPLAWYPRLAEASDAERAEVEFSFDGVHWPLLDEDLSVAGMLRGVRPPDLRKDSVSR
jgi:hypothetical protein